MSGQLRDGRASAACGGRLQIGYTMDEDEERKRGNKPSTETGQVQLRQRAVRQALRELLTQFDLTRATRRKVE